jgi:hypothetical protein
MNCKLIAAGLQMDRTDIPCDRQLPMVSSQGSLGDIKLLSYTQFVEAQCQWQTSECCGPLKKANLF